MALNMTTPMSTRNSTLGSVILIIEASLRSYGVDPMPLLHNAGIDHAQLRQTNVRIPNAQVKQLLHHAIQASGDYSFGLTMKKHMDINGFQTLGLAMSMSNSLLDGIQKIIQYQRIINTALNIQLHEHPHTYELSYTRPDHSVPSPHVTDDFCLASLIGFFEARTQSQSCHQHIALTHTPPSHLLPRYYHYLGENIAFGAEEMRLTLDKRAMEKELFPVPSAMMNTTETLLKQELASVIQLPLPEVVRHHIEHTLTQGETNPEHTAAHLNMSYRTMQRRLAEHNTSYRAILDDTRKAFATRWVIKKKKPLIEVAFLLGFSDASSFSRSFKRWTGTTPARYRDNHSAMGTFHAVGNGHSL